MIKISATETQWPLVLHAKKTALAQRFAALAAGRVPNDPKDNDLVLLLVSHVGRLLLHASTFCVLRSAFSVKSIFRIMAVA
jgi:hypothetical protein